MSHTTDNDPTDKDLEFEVLVEAHYKALYQFAFSLTHSEADASDLTQETFLTWARKGHQLNDKTKVKTWLFTTLHHAFLRSIRRYRRFPHQDLDTATDQIPSVPPLTGAKLDCELVMNALQRLDETYRTPLVLFYMEDIAYAEIADILGVPLGTVRSRIARAKAELCRVMNQPGDHNG